MSLTIRKTARAVILTPSHEVLFIRTAYPWFDKNVWMLPGGGVKLHEDVLTAVTREIFEETGARNLSIVGEIWREELIITTKNIILKLRVRNTSDRVPHPHDILMSHAPNHHA